VRRARAFRAAAVVDKGIRVTTLLAIPPALRAGGMVTKQN
jgi:hypothetical protein